MYCHKEWMSRLQKIDNTTQYIKETTYAVSYLQLIKSMLLLLEDGRYEYKRFQGTILQSKHNSMKNPHP
jgi:hypothetical protein